MLILPIACVYEEPELQWLLCSFIVKPPVTTGGPQKQGFETMYPVLPANIFTYPSPICLVYDM